MSRVKREQDKIKMNHLFVYGTLLFPQVMRAITGRDCTGEPAALDGYARFAVRKQVFPGIVEMPGGQVEGILYRDIGDTDFSRLDEFESDIYFRRQVTVSLGDRSCIHAYTYVVASDFRHLLDDRCWDPDHFQEAHLDAYLARLL